MKKFFVFALMLLISIGGSAMILTVSLDELTEMSDLIAKVEVVEVVESRELESGIIIMANKLTLAEIIKGDNYLDCTEVIVETAGNITGVASFEPGFNYLVFLQQKGDVFEVANGIQGSWAIYEDGTYGGLGTDYSLKDIKEAIK